jgi:hypothetical protein
MTRQTLAVDSVHDGISAPEMTANTVSLAAADPAEQHGHRSRWASTRECSGQCALDFESRTEDFVGENLDIGVQSPKGIDFGTEGDS